MEERIIKLAKRVMLRHGVNLIFPQRKLWIRRKGVRRQEESPIFPGYLFLESEELTPELYRALKTEVVKMRFLRISENFAVLSEADLELLRSFLRFGEIIGPSLVKFDENQKIKVIKGALSGLEGKIIKVDRRKGRARVLVNFQNQTFQIDLGFETLEAESV